VNPAVRDVEVEDRDAAAESRANADADLARRAVARDAAAWSEIFELHYRSVFSFVRFRLRSVEEAEDIAGQVFEVAFSRAHRFDYRGVPIEGWLIGIARNLVRDFAKKAARRGVTAELDEGMAVTTSEAEHVQVRADLAAAMLSLTDDQQTVLALRFLMDRSVEDTARSMARSEDAVKTLQRRALAAMERVLSAGGFREGPR
jgi:RNA polymerase sigma-70 factor (ECF subfamily)